MEIEWNGQGLDELGIDKSNGQAVVKVDARYFRPTEVDALLGDPTKARTKLGWRCEISFDSLVKEMVQEDLRIARRDAVIAREGFKTYRYHE
jgi:GDPmannose 4,6-dehydratase